MKTIPKQEIIDWVMRQPRDKEIKMSEHTFEYSPCGCYGLQFAREKWPEKVKNSKHTGFVGGSSFYFGFKDDPIKVSDNFSFVDYASVGEELTYGELQDRIKNDLQLYQKR